MKTSAVLFFLGLHSLSALAQELSPSPTESVGCEPHGDHWHCEGPRPPVTSEAATELPPPVTTTTPAEPATTASEAEDDHTDVVDPGPSPTESIGCEPHGDHWHCEGPREPAETSSKVSSSELTGSLTIVTTTAATTTTGGAASGTGALTSTTSGPVFTAGAAAGPMAAAAPIFGLAVFAALGL